MKYIDRLFHLTLLIAEGGKTQYCIGTGRNLQDKEVR